MLLNCISAGVVTGYSETIGKFAGLGYFHFKYHNDNPGIFNSRVPAAFGYSLQLGAKYYFTNQAELYAKAGYIGGSFGQLGIAVKFYGLKC
jgi:hypothetical protein